MATRVHVVAARGVEREAFVKAFNSFKNLEVEEAGGWVWFMASVWQVSASDLIGVLQTMPGTGFLLTTEDACRWYLSLWKPGEDPFVVCHEFTLLPDDETEDDAEEEEDAELDIDTSSFGVEEMSIAIPTTRKGVQVYADDGFFNIDEEDLDDDEDDDEDDGFYASHVGSLIQEFEELGTPLPDDLVAAMKDLSYREACKAIVEWQSDQVVSALDRFDVPHDQDEVRAVLTGASVTPAELESDIGNMPRFLAALGFGPEASKWLDQQTSRGEYDEDEDEDEDENYADAVRDAVADLALTPVAGGPVQVPLEQVGYLFAIGTFCDDQADGILKLAAASSEVMAFPDNDEFSVCQEQDESGLTVGFSHCETAFLESPEIIESWLEKLPEGTVLELATAGPELDAGRLRFRGEINDGIWQVAESHPPVDAKSLRDAIALVDTLESGKPIVARDKAEIKKVLARVDSLADIFMGRIPRVEGRTFQVDEMFRSIIAQLCFRHRHGDVWDLSPMEARENASYSQLQDMKQSFDKELLAHAPATDEVILTSGMDTYRRGDLEKLEQVKASTVAALDKQMQAAGFELLGDLWSSELPLMAMRCYGNEEVNSYGIAYFGMDDSPPLDFYTRFTDGASLTTTTLEEIYSMRAQKIWYRSSPATAPKGLFKDHQTGLAKLGGQNGREPEPITPSLEGVAKAIAEFSARKIRAYM